MQSATNTADSCPPRGSAPIPGRCLVDHGAEAICAAHEMTLDGARIVASTHAGVGDAVTCYLDDIGMVRGRVSAHTRDGFRLHFDLSDGRRGRLAARLEWHTARGAAGSEKRAAPRIVPLLRDVLVRLDDDTVVPGRIIDLSLSGAAIALDLRSRPFVGSLVRVGKRYATVMRLLEDGLAVQFKLPFVAETFDQHVVL